MVNKAFSPTYCRHIFSPRLCSILFLLLFSSFSLAAPEKDKDRDHGPQATKACPKYLTFDKFDPLVRLFREYFGSSIFTADEFRLLWQMRGDVSRALIGGKKKRGEFNSRRMSERIGNGNLYLGRQQNNRIFVQGENLDWAIGSLKLHFPNWLNSSELVAFEIKDVAILLFDEDSQLPLIVPRGSLVVMDLNRNFPVRIFYTLDHLGGH